MTTIVEFVLWWAVVTGVWMASLSAWSWHDLVVAAGCGIPAALCAVGGRRAVRGAWRMPKDALRWLLHLPAAVVVDALRVFSLPFRRRPEAMTQFVSVDLGVTGQSARAAGHFAAATLVLSLTPGSYFVATDPKKGTALLHAVGPPSSLQRAVSS
ncbi:MAG TPA: Na+/H+ antiporter subunit E [Mycobacteriales bacterium]|nr:Na+/H+ antiporter subunit E [Mycobacteriales bacterium]